ncbi:MAG: hypothetical protein ABIF40_02710 [archaeon]
MRFLKQLFKKEVEKKSLKLDEVGAWLIANIDLDLQKDINEITEILKEIKTSIKDLEKVDLTSHKVEKKVLQKVQGNKKAYIGTVNQFLTKIQMPKNFTYDEINTFIKTTTKEMNDFHKKSVKNYAITKYLVGKELDDIVNKIQYMDQKLKKLRKDIDEKDLKLIEEIHEKLKEINKTKMLTSKRGTKIQEYDQIIQDLIQQQFKQKEKIKILKESKQYYQLNDWLNEEDYLKEHLGAIKNMLLNKFSTLEKALKKLYNRNKSNTLKQYLENPYEALTKDSDLKIGEELLKVKFEIDKLNLKLEKKKKTLETISELTESELKLTRKNILEMKDKLSKVQKNIANNDVEKKNLQLIEDLNKLIKKSTIIEYKKQSLQEVNLDKDIIFIKENLKRITGKEITILD